MVRKKAVVGYTLSLRTHRGCHCVCSVVSVHVRRRFLFAFELCEVVGDGAFKRAMRSRAKSLRRGLVSFARVRVSVFNIY